MELNYPAIIRHGAVDGVTGSCHELIVNEASSVLIDCGWFGPIYCSQPNAQLLLLVLKDTVAVGISKDSESVTQFVDLIKSRRPYCGLRLISYAMSRAG